ncbi:energy transducer TonB [candidate division WOR-3 bacterium]|nr:energy transducer TonB [candidate division WOR-3 bacterium]
MNNDLKERLPFHNKLSFLIAIIACILACLFIPKTRPRKWEPKVDAVVRAIQLPPQMQQLKEPPPPPKPKMPVAAESEKEIEASTIDRTDFGFEKRPPKLTTPEVYEFWAVEVKPQLKLYVEPEYPELARKAEIEGTVYLELIIDTSGRVINVKVLQSLNELCDQAAMRAARKWKFSPAQQRDRPVCVKVHQPVRFRLKE